MVTSAVLLASCGDGASSSLPAETSSQPASSSLSSSAAPSSSAPQGLAPGANPLTGLALPEGMDPATRPVAVMVDNNIRGVPQRGLAAADVLVEMPVEDGTTRLLAIYPGYAAVPHVGPVCDVQDQFLQFCLPYSAIPVYTDATTYARNLLSAAGQKAIDGIVLGEISFWFDEGRTVPKPGGYLNEFCWYTDPNLIYQGMTVMEIAASGTVAPMFRFASQAAPAQQTAGQINVAYSDMSAATLSYTAETREYMLVNSPWHTDEDGAAKTYQNVLLLRCNIGQKADSRYLEYDFSGGDGWYFTAGGVQAITWQKGDALARLVIYGQDGAEIQVQPGKSYVGFVPLARENAVSWLSFDELAALAAQQPAAE